MDKNRLAAVLANTAGCANPLLIVGCPRSGTTMLARAVASSDSVCYLEESGLDADVYPAVTPLCRLWRKSSPAEPRWLLLRSRLAGLWWQLRGRCRLRGLVESMIRHARLPEFDLRPSNRLVDRYEIVLTPEDLQFAEALRTKYQRLARQDPEQMTRVVVRDFQLLTGKQWFLGKTPLEVLFMHTTFRLFPEARICQITRAFRNVASSYVQTFGQQHRFGSPVQHIYNVYRQALALQETLHRSGEPRYIHVNYEQLLADPRGQLEKVFTFFGVACDEAGYARIGAGIRETRPTWDGLTEPQKEQIEALDARLKA